LKEGDQNEEEESTDKLPSGGINIGLKTKAPEPRLKQKSNELHDARTALDRFNKANKGF
jgi:hypothetical protein